MGTIVLQACDERVCLEHAVVLIHHVKNDQLISLDMLESRDKRAKLLKSMRADQKALYDILAKRTGKSVAEIRRVCRKDVDMIAEDALKFGLIDRIDRGERKSGEKQ